MSLESAHEMFASRESDRNGLGSQLACEWTRLRKEQILFTDLHLARFLRN